MRLKTALGPQLKINRASSRALIDLGIILKYLFVSRRDTGWDDRLTPSSRDSIYHGYSHITVDRQCSI